jgi:hypothetical protein
LFDKAGNMPVGQAQKIVNHKDLPVIRWPGTDTYRGNLELLSDGFSDIGRNAFQHHGISAGRLDHKGINQKSVFVPLNSISAHLMNRLWGQADMCLNRNSGQGYALDHTADGSSAFQRYDRSPPPSLMNRPALATAVSTPV